MQVGNGRDDRVAEDDCKVHGTSMLSLVAGSTLGPAKKIRPVVVRLPCRGRFVLIRPTDWIDALGMVNDDLDGQTPAVVLMASYFENDDDRFKLGAQLSVFGFSARHWQLLHDMARKGAVLVTGSGNAQVPTIDGYPANFGKPNMPDSLPTLLVAGGITPDGLIPYGRTDFANGLPHVYAAGNFIESAEADESLWGGERGPYKTTFGTSCAAAYTAGLAANLLRMAQLGTLSDNGHQVSTDPQAIKDFIISRAWSRQTVQGRARPGLWNGVNIALPAQPWTPHPAAALFRRRARNGDFCRL